MSTATEGRRYNLRTRRASDSAVNVADPQGRASGTTTLPLFSEVVSGRLSSGSAIPQNEVPVSAERSAGTDNGDGVLDTGGPWITVRYGRNGHRNAPENNTTNVSSTRKVNDNLSSTPMLTDEQENLVNIAISQMSDEDIARIRTRTAKVRISEDDNASSISQDTVEPKDKGKAIDPRNWGNVEIDESEMDPEIQQAILTEFNDAWDAKRINNSPPGRYSPVRRTTWVEQTNDIEAPQIGRPVAQVTSSLQPGRGTSEAITDQLEAQLGNIVNGKNRAEKGARVVETKRTRLTKPSEQIAPGSHLDRALSRASGKGKHPGYPSNDDEDLSSKSDSSTETDHGTGGRKNRHRKLNIKPDPPEKYNGTPNVQTFLKFSTEVTEYLRDANIHRSRWVFRASKYLSESAYECYLAVAADDPFIWNLKDFLIELYNHCFPITYRLEQRTKLKRFYQGSWTVRQYCMKLKELFNTVGVMDEREKIHKLWSGFTTTIQQGLWQKELHPEYSTYAEIERVAALVEVVDNVKNMHKTYSTTQNVNPRTGNYGRSNRPVQANSQPGESRASSKNLTSDSQQNGGSSRSVGPGHAYPFRDSTNHYTLQEEDSLSTSGTDNSMPGLQSVSDSSQSSGFVETNDNEMYLEAWDIHDNPAETMSSAIVERTNESPMSGDNTLPHFLSETKLSLCGNVVNSESLNHVKSEFDGWYEDETNNPCLTTCLPYDEPYIQERCSVEYRPHNQPHTWNVRRTEAWVGRSVNAQRMRRAGWIPDPSRGVWKFNYLDHGSYGYVLDPPPCAFGDVLAQTAQYYLDRSAPYPGESMEQSDEHEYVGRFCVYRTSDTHHVISDSHYYGSFEEDEFVVPSLWLECADFCVVEWYAVQQSIQLGLHRDEWPIGDYWVGEGQMGVPYLNEVRDVLELHEPYPGDHYYPSIIGPRFETSLEWDAYQLYAVRIVDNLYKDAGMQNALPG
ncbi:hypothetical protein DFH05DRAFT_1559358 [Lentinula detonsa]|uniref:Retrotransposon gag domain-containing protein n=1 Tax=Lentinula detonsa TaxID=2804962 RepID=A0A9W8NVN9_9AGAR|nr:hypothetical protein DFH05DRAFT_1559358 [Lentinula detonsa]